MAVILLTIHISEMKSRRILQTRHGSRPRPWKKYTLFLQVFLQVTINIFWLFQFKFHLEFSKTFDIKNWNVLVGDTECSMCFFYLPFFLESAPGGLVLLCKECMINLPSWNNRCGSCRLECEHYFRFCSLSTENN